MKKPANVCRQQDGFYFKGKFLYLCSNPYISNIYNPDPDLSVAPETICDHIFSDQKSDYMFHVFGYVFVLYFVSYRVWKLSVYFKEDKVLESTLS